MLFCINCCEPCVVCRDQFKYPDQEGVKPGKCKWSGFNDAISVANEKLVLYPSVPGVPTGIISEKGCERITLITSGRKTGDVLLIGLGFYTAEFVFGSPGRMTLTGGELGFVTAETDAPPGTDVELELCVGFLESDDTQYAIRFANLTTSDVIGDTLPTEETLLIPTVAATYGKVTVDDITLWRTKDPEVPKLADCPECLAPDPPPPDCEVCRDGADRADNDDISVGAPCDWDPSSGGSISGGRFLLVDGDEIFGPDGDYVVLSVNPTGSPRTVTIKIGDIHGVLAIGADSTTMSLAGAGIGVAGPAVVNNLFGPAQTHTFILCIGQVGNKWGALFWDANAPMFTVSGSLSVAGEPTSPYGAIAVEVAGGAVYLDSIGIYLREFADEPCGYCRPALCAICSDDATTLALFSTTDCGWTPVLGSVTDNVADVANTVTVSTQQNHDGLPVMFFGVFWIWDTGAVGDTVQARVATNASGGNGVKVEAIKGDGGVTAYGCLKMYKASGALRTVVPYDDSSFLGINCDGTDVWMNGNLTYDSMLGMNNTPLPGGGHAAFGVGALGVGSTVTFISAELSWYALSPTHTHCPDSYRTCHITSVGFASAGDYDAGDPAGVVHCTVTFTAAAWARDGVNGAWITNDTDAEITILTAHPVDDVHLNAFAQWHTTNSLVPTADGSYREVNGLTLKFKHGPGSFWAWKFLGCAAGTSYTATFFTVTLNGSSGIACEINAAGVSIPSVVQACFGETRARLAFATFGKRDTAGPTLADGTGFGFKTGDSLWGTVGGHPILSVKNFLLEHSKVTTPSNVFAEGDALDCIDCDKNHCAPCENATLDRIVVNIALKPGADTTDYCASDIARLVGAHTLLSHLNDCVYSIYFGPNSEVAVDDFIQDLIDNFDPVTEDPRCLRFIGIIATLGTGGAGFSADVTAYALTDAPTFGQYSWSGSRAVAGLDCANWTITATNGLNAFADLFDVTVESP